MEKQKGNLGLTLPALAVIAFVLALFSQVLLAGLLLALVLLREKDEWLSRQCLQAFFLSLLTCLFSGALLRFWSMMPSLSYRMEYVVGLFVLCLLGLCTLFVVVLVFSVMGLVNVAKGREANLPLLAGLAYKAQGFRKQAPPPAPYPVQPPPPPPGPYPPASYPPGQAYAPPSYAPPPAPPAPPPAPPAGYYDTQPLAPAPEMPPPASETPPGAPENPDGAGQP